jgi:CheY-like chemotaxis protein
MMDKDKKVDTKNHKGEVLVIDDEKGVAETLQDILRNYRVTPVYSASDAINVLKERTYDVIILDMLMEPMSGDKLIPILQERHPHIPVIVHTGYPGLFEEKKIMENIRGFHYFTYLVKGGNPQVLIEKVDKAFEYHNSYKENIKSELNEIFNNDNVCKYTIIFDPIEDKALSGEDLPKSKDEIEKILNSNKEVKSFCRISPLINQIIKEKDKTLCPFLYIVGELYNVFHFGIKSYICNYYSTINPLRGGKK